MRMPKSTMKHEGGRKRERLGRLTGSIEVSRRLGRPLELPFVRKLHNDIGHFIWRFKIKMINTYNNKHRRKDKIKIKLN